MYSYSLTQWVLFFFWYCFLGWIWECFYVSFQGVWKNKKWNFINRGFLHGPVIPIYGFAAIAILLSTIRFRDNVGAVYLVGAITATLFELVTGTVMERLFKVRYWDYSNLPLNYHGHICFFISMFWGFFAVLLVQVIHIPIERVLLRFPVLPCEVVAFSLMAVFGYDFRTSFAEAMDLRELLESLTENNAAIKRLERRFDAIVAFSLVQDKNDLLNLRLTARERITYNVERLRWQNENRIQRLKERISLPEFDGLSDRRDIVEKLEACHRRIWEKNNKVYLRALSQLKRNPTAKSEKHQEAMEVLRNVIRRKN